MNNRAALKQARKGQDSLINESPETFTMVISGTTTIPEGWPGYVASETKVFTARLPHERSIVPVLEGTPAGMSTNLQRFLTCGYLVDYLYKGAIITDSKGNNWRLGKPDPLEKFGGIYGYQVSVEEANGG